MSDPLFNFSNGEIVEQQGWITDVAFDPRQELVWVASQKGYISSFYSCGLQKYTKFLATFNELRQILPIDAGILSLSANQLNLHSRMGLPKLSFQSQGLDHLCCMCASGQSNVLLGGHHNVMTKYDLHSQKVVEEVPLPNSGCVLIKETPSLTCLGSPDGDILLFDRNTMKKSNVIQAHTGTISDFDISDNMLVSCGFSSRGNELTVKRSLLVYDLRMMRSLNAIHCNIDPVQLRFMPMYHSQVLIASQSGQFQQVEVTSTLPQSNKYFEVDLGGSNCYAVDLSSTSKALAVGDSSGMVHLLAQHENTTFNSFSQPTVFPAEMTPHFPKIGIDDMSFSLAAVPLPHTAEHLLSAWPPEYCLPGDRRSLPLDPELLRNMKIVKYVGYAPNPNNMYKNTIPYDLTCLQREVKYVENEHERMIPRVYQRIDIDPSTLSSEDLWNYNRTEFSVLYSSSNSNYVCTVLQLLYYLEPVCLALKSHICSKRNCLACELGFLFYTLDVTDDKVTHANAFMQVFESLQDAELYGLITRERCPEKKQLLELPQNLLKFLLQHLHKEIVQPPTTSNIFLTFGSKVQNRSVCGQCGTHKTNNTINLTYTLEYPRQLETSINFLQVLKSTMQNESMRPRWCNACADYKTCTENMMLESLPYILHINCGMQSQEDILFWQKQCTLSSKDKEEKRCKFGGGCNKTDCELEHSSDPSASWLPLNFYVSAGSDGTLLFEEGVPPETGGVFEYELCAVIAHIDSHQASGLMLHSLVSKSYHNRREHKSNVDHCWYLFNGCSATNTAQKESVSFGQTWKSPCVLMYKQVKLPKELFNVTLPSPLDLFSPPMINNKGILPLSQHEIPSVGELVGVGVEVRSPVNVPCLVRIVLVRGQGSNEGVPFSEDVCASSLTSEMPALTPVKVLYFKLKYLIDRGVILVGHNVVKSLKFLNIQIPSSLHIDVAQLYNDGSGLSPPLTFIATQILGAENIAGQGVANEASQCLQLYEKYLDLKRTGRGKLDQAIKSLHEAARGETQ